MSANSRATNSLVSVILPTRNRATLLRRAVASVLAQTYRDFELIVVDDGSSDTTPQVLAGIADTRLRVIRRDSDHGVTAARNAGIREAQGALLAFQDDDDIWLVDKLEKQMRALQAAPPSVGWCLAGYIRLKPQECTYIGGERFFRDVSFGHGGSRVGLDQSLIATPNWLLRKEVLDRSGLFDERLRAWDDWELALRVRGATQCIHLDEPLYIQDHCAGGGVSMAPKARVDGMRIIMEKHSELWANQPDVLARHYFLIGRGASVLEPAPAGRRELWLSLRLQPFKFKTWLALFLAYVAPRATGQPPAQAAPKS